MLNQYFKDIYKTYKAGDATEASYYGDLKTLSEKFLESKGVDPNITVQPKRTNAGIPDFTVRRGKELIGYIEAKDLTINDLESIEYTEQIERYKEKFPNFILTNYFDFWLWRRDTIDDKKGRWVKKVKIGQPVSLKLNLPPQSQKEKEFFELLNLFFSYYLPERKTAKSLAIELASRAQLLPPFIIEELNNNTETEIDRIYSAFKKFLIHDLSREDFADIYAQTITYGLFTARLRYQGKDFNRFLAQELIPKNIQILHDTFNLISHEKLTESLAWIIDDMATVLAHADIEKIKKELHREKGGDDPLIHFYETFLAEYDPKKRKARGVYYTPLPVVSYITRSINILLKEKFDKKMGFASEGVTLLDPASGTLTFPANSIMIAKEEVDKSPNAGSWLQIVKNHILKDYYAFELLMAPYIIGHLKTSLLLEDLGYELKNGERFQLYLTNALDLSKVEQSQMPFVARLSEEAQKASIVKKEIPILIIMGNPPYSSGHYEQSEFVKTTMKDYLTGLNVEKERKKGVMQDDYIRFIRFAHWKIEQTGKGIIGFITNNSYLDGVIHRAMRKKILDDFDGIYILNLHGNSRLKEKTPGGEKDENVFDIQQGVGIIFLFKGGKSEKRVKYFDLYGLREEKYRFLENHDITNTDWQALKPRESQYFLVPKDTKGQKEYQRFISISDIFLKSGSGVITRRDNFAVATNKNELKNRILTFINKNLPIEIIESGLSIKDTYEWSIKKAREELINDSDLDKKYFEYLYRPFDKRWIIYHENLISRPSVLLRQCFVNHDNLGLLCSRKIPAVTNFNHIFVSNFLSDIHSSADQTYVFPLYFYPTENEISSWKEYLKKVFLPRGADLFNAQEVDNLYKIYPQPLSQMPNLTLLVINIIKNNFRNKILPKEIFYYIYGILYSNVYRRKYGEFLKIDFPRIPFTKDNLLFQKLSKLGSELIDLHLLKSKALEKSLAKFFVTGDSIIEKAKYQDNKIYINKKQYFEGVEPEVWDYYIGGYQILDKWLKDRTGKILSSKDVDYFLKVISAIKYTIDLQKQIDKIYPEIEKSLI